MPDVPADDENMAEPENEAKEGEESSNVTEESEDSVSGTGSEAPVEDPSEDTEEGDFTEDKAADGAVEVDPEPTDGTEDEAEEQLNTVEDEIAENTQTATDEGGMTDETEGSDFYGMYTVTEQPAMATAETPSEYIFTLNNMQYLLKDYSITAVKYTGSSAEVTIPMTINDVRVTVIGAQAFMNNSALETIHVPNYIEVIGESAFENCVKLAEMSPDSTEEVTIDIENYDEKAPKAQTVSVKGGEQCRVNICLHGYDIASAKVKVSYDSNCFELVNGETSLGTFSDNIFTLSGKLMDAVAAVTLKAKAGIEAGTYDVSVEVIETKDANGGSVKCFGYSDHIKAEAGMTNKLPGDLNNDGKVNLKDSILLDQHLAGWSVSYNETNADVNGDGKVNLKDSILLDQYLAGWESEYIK